MFHYFGVAQNAKGDALPGWFVECVDLVSGAVVPIYYDENGTPIASVSGAANWAKSDARGNYDFFVNDGNYSLNFYNASGVFQWAQRYLPMYGNLSGALADGLDQINTAKDAAAVSAASADADALAALAFKTAAATSETNSATSAGNSSLYAAAAQAFASGNFFADTAVPLTYGVSSLVITGNGTGGTNGTFAGSYTGGGGTGAAFSFVVAAGAVVPSSIVITNKGAGYTSDPTPVFTASSGLTGVTATLTRAPRTTPGDYLLVVGTGNVYASLYRNVAGVITAQGLDIPSKAALDAVVLACAPLTDGFDKHALTETYTHGVTSADGSSGPVSSLIWLNNPVPRSGLVSKVKGWARSTGATEVHFHSQNGNGDRVFEGKVTFTVAAASTALDPASQEWDVSAQAFRVQRGWFVGWKSGARVAVATEPASLYSATAPTDGTPITPTYLANYPAFSVEIVRDTIVAEGAVKDAIDTIPLMPPAGVHFLSPSNTARIRAAIAKVRSGVPMDFEESLVLAIADSNTAGAMVGTNGAYTDSFDRNWFAKLADQLPKLIRDDGLNIPTQRTSSFMGANNPQGGYTLYNPHCVSLGDWAQNGTTSYLSIGGAMFVSTTVGGTVAEFAIADDIDTIELGFPISGALSLGVFQYSTDAGATWTSVDQSGASAYGTQTITPAAGTGRTIRFKHLSGTCVALHRMFAHDSTVAALNFVNGAIPGSRASTTWTTFASPWSPLTLLRTQAAALKIIMLGSNDIDDGVTLDDYLLWLRREIYAGQAKSDVWVVTPPPLQVDGNPNHALARQVSFYAGLYDLCGELNVPFFNMAADFGTWAQANADGLMGNYIHVNFYGDDRIFYMAFDAFERLG